MDNALISALAEALKPTIREAIRENLREFAKDLSLFREDKPDLICIDEAADLVGLSKQTLYTRTSQGTIPHHKRGKRLYFSRIELDKWIKNNE